MYDPELAQRARTHAAHYAPQIAIVLDTIMPGAAWTDRLRGWYADCRDRPVRAFGPDRLEAAMDDLVTLQLAREAISADPIGLRITDRGGVVSATMARAALLSLVAECDPTLAQHLATRTRARLCAQGRVLVHLIAARAGRAPGRPRLRGRHPPFFRPPPFRKIHQ